jgi:hypothetical protein
MYDWYRIRVYRVRRGISGSTRNLFTTMCTCWDATRSNSPMVALIKTYVRQHFGPDFDCEINRIAISETPEVPGICFDYKNISKYVNGKTFGRQRMKLTMRRLATNVGEINQPPIDLLSSLTSSD